jgi:hypothetical protein
VIDPTCWFYHTFFLRPKNWESVVRADQAVGYGKHNVWPDWARDKHIAGPRLGASVARLGLGESVAVEELPELF